ncbi:MAG: hypothetical protein R3E79_19680 [Caldilineaceae bacterium]
MASEGIIEATSDTAVYRVSGGYKENLQLSQIEKELTPFGISVLLGDTPQAAALQMRNAFPRSRKWMTSAHQIGTATVQTIRNAGFDVILDPTTRFPNHARLIHPAGLAGFTDENLERLAQAFKDTVEG